jgi:hypothetical protein
VFDEITKASPANVLMVLQFLVPGFLVIFSRSIFVVRRKSIFKDDLLLYVTISILYGFFLLPFLKFLQFFDSPTWKWIFWICVLIFVPSVLGGLLGVGAQKDWGRKAFNYFGLQPTSPYPTSWDQRFAQLNSACYIIVTWQDGSQIAGFFGENSYAASSIDNRDLYLEKVWKLTEDGQWDPLKDSDGVLISVRDAKTVEFLRPGGADYG